VISRELKMFKTRMYVNRREIKMFETHKHAVLPDTASVCKQPIRHHNEFDSAAGNRSLSRL
jgi:hypothetical protein